MRLEIGESDPFQLLEVIDDNFRLHLSRQSMEVNLGSEAGPYVPIAVGTAMLHARRLILLEHL